MPDVVARVLLLALRLPVVDLAVRLAGLLRAEREGVPVFFAFLEAREAAFLGVEDVERPPLAVCFLAM